MNAASAIVLVAVFAAAGFAVWRNMRKGAPCSCGCGGECRRTGGECHCHDGGK
ncbi:MAG: FeoB-associated Cys-rich membrane protein [Kiritimatiellae bacterium]|nr:FeoB-associated Cys-rich membrane protein [Kiritimatiellia bacterium]